jgi:hypothetical protein
MSYPAFRSAAVWSLDAQDAREVVDAMERTPDMTRRPYVKPKLERLGLLRTLTRFSCPPGAWGDGCVVNPKYHHVVD